MRSKLVFEVLRPFLTLRKKMACAIKYKWPIKQYGRFIYEDEIIEMASKKNEGPEKNNGGENSCRNGTWKITESEKGDLFLSYLEGEHLMLTKRNIILESFSLIGSSDRMRGIFKEKTLMIVEQYEGGWRRFRLEFDDVDDKTAVFNCNDCIAKLNGHFPLRNNDLLQDVFEKEPSLEKINEALLDKVYMRRVYTSANSCTQLKDMVLLCLIDSSFPSFVAEVQNVLKELDK